MDFETVERSAGKAGLAVCGAFNPGEADGVPAVAGRPARSRNAIRLTGIEGAADRKAGFPGRPLNRLEIHGFA